MTEIYMGAAQRGSEDTSAFNARVTALEDQCGSETLTTTAQTLSGAVNELDDDLGDAETLLGSETLTTTAQTVTGAINELDSAVGTNATDIGTLETLAGDTALPTTAQTLTGAIAELDTDIGHCAVVSHHTNGALELADGKVTWEITTAKWQYCVVSVYITSTGVEVIPLSVTHTTNKITLELEADVDVEADYFTATIVG